MIKTMMRKFLKTFFLFFDIQKYINYKMQCIQVMKTLLFNILHMFNDVQKGSIMFNSVQ